MLPVRPLLRLRAQMLSFRTSALGATESKRSLIGGWAREKVLSPLVPHTRLDTYFSAVPLLMPLCCTSRYVV
eukprot:13134169-Heterocapsa_arctica.AAC.1